METFLQEIINNAQADLATAARLEKKWHDIVYMNAKREDETLYWLLFDKYIWDKLTYRREKIIKEASMKLAALRGNKGRGVSFEEVEQAKARPIDEMMEFRQNSARCIFHNDKTASLHYYKKENHVHCFGACGKSYDAIDVFMQLNDCDFIQAVKALQ